MSSQDFEKPFVAIVGAPRTGTTSLARFLRRHPDVCFSKVKEPHFFSQHDLNGLSDEELRETVGYDYLDRYYPHRDEERCKVLAEGSVTYLYAPEQMQPILRLWPNAKFIVSLRDPMEMLPSLHQRLLYLGDESVEDFDRAWRLVPERAQGRKIPRSCIEPRWLRYDEVGKLGSYVERFIDVVGRERCFFSVHDDMRANSAKLYADLLEFLDLPPYEDVDLKPKRLNRGFKSGTLQRLLMRPPVITRKLVAGKHMRRRTEKVEKLKKPESGIMQGIERGRKQLLKWNRADAPPIKLSSKTRAEIREHYRPDIEHLGRILNRDLSHWLPLVKPEGSKAR